VTPDSNVQLRSEMANVALEQDCAAAKGYVCQEPSVSGCLSKVIAGLTTRIWMSYGIEMGTYRYSSEDRRCDQYAVEVEHG